MFRIIPRGNAMPSDQETNDNQSGYASRPRPELPEMATVTHVSFVDQECPCLVLVPCEDTPKACLDALVDASADLTSLFAAHSQIDETKPQFGWAWRLAARLLVEADLFPRVAAEDELRPLIETYVRQVIDFANRPGTVGFYVDGEIEAGSKAVESLVIANPDQYLPLYMDYLEAIDLERTVEQHRVVKRITVRLSKEQDRLLLNKLSELPGGEQFPRF